MFCVSRFAVITLLYLCHTTTSLNILQITAGYNPSHVFFSYGMAEALTKHGHNITLILFQHFLDMSFVPSPPSITEYRIASSAGPEILRLGAEAYDAMSFSSKTLLSSLGAIYFGLDSQVAHCKALFHADGNSLVKRLKSARFDVALTHMFDLCPLFLFDTLGVKSVTFHSALSSIINTIAIPTGTPMLPSYIPEPYFARSSDTMDFFERVGNVGKERCQRHAF